MTEQEKTENRLKHYYNEEGLLTRYPSKRPLRQIVWGRLIALFATGRDYTEKEVNEIIKGAIAFDDVELLRRELVDEKLLCRLRDGSRYWKGEA